MAVKNKKKMGKRAKTFPFNTSTNETSYIPGLILEFCRRLRYLFRDILTPNTFFFIWLGVSFSIFFHNLRQSFTEKTRKKILSNKNGKMKKQIFDSRTIIVFFLLLSPKRQFWEHLFSRLLTKSWINSLSKKHAGSSGKYKRF